MCRKKKTIKTSENYKNVLEAIQLEDKPSRKK